jgi:hypothetical protein
MSKDGPFYFMTFWLHLPDGPGGDGVWTPREEFVDEHPLKVLMSMKRETNNSAAMNWWTEVDRITYEKYKRELADINEAERLLEGGDPDALERRSREHGAIHD